MLLLLTSGEAVAPRGVPDSSFLDALEAIQATGTPVGIVSNHQQPDWFAPLAKKGVTFVHQVGRQDGQLIHYNASRFGVQTHDVLVLAATREDVMMGKNGRGVLVAAPSSQQVEVRALGISIRHAADLKAVVALSVTWQGAWWFSADTPTYRVRALCDLSSKGQQALSQVDFSQRVTSTVKSGGPKLMALLTVACRSLLRDGVADVGQQMWGVYPASASQNNDADTLCDLTHRLRTTVSRVHFAERGRPLFVRHTPSVKRSTSTSNRTDPSNQVETIQLNPYYRNKIRGRNVFVVDDCTTYGVSFGVAAAFLRKAGAITITGVALGKFGNQFHHFDISIKTSPFAPVTRGNYTVRSAEAHSGSTDDVAQATLRNILA